MLASQSLVTPRVTMPHVWSEAQLLHEPAGEVWVGVRIPGTEVPERAAAIRDALDAAGAPRHEPLAVGPQALETVHDPDLIGYLESAWRDWVESGYLVEPGQDRVVPYVFALPGVAAPGRIPAAVSARAGAFAFDTMTLIGPGTFQAAVAAASCAHTAARLVVDGADAAYAGCRPPGHHAGRRFFGGSCYLNNAALAADAVTAGGARVAVIDIDAHHGNGTQEIFYERSDVLYASVHVDPGAGWFPHFAGFADEVGTGAGVGTNLNVPLAPGAADQEWLAAVAEVVAAVAEWNADRIVVSLGVDAAGEDPESPLDVTGDGYAAAGALVGSLGMGTVFVQEGGYRLDTLGELVVRALEGFERERGRP